MKEVLQQFKQNYLIKYWNPVAAVIAAGAYFSLLLWGNWHLLGGYGGIYPLGRSCFASARHRCVRLELL